MYLYSPKTGKMKKISLIIVIVFGLILPVIFLKIHWYQGGLITLTLLLTLEAILIVVAVRKQTAGNIRVVDRIGLEAVVTVEDVNFSEIKETDYLTCCGPDQTISPKPELEKTDLDMFRPWNDGGHIFPAVHPFFMEALRKEELYLKKEEVPQSRVSIRPFEPKRSRWDPLNFFSSFHIEPIFLSLPAKAIIQYALDNKDRLGSNNFFILKPQVEGEVKAEDLRIVDIIREEEGQCFIHCYPYSHWSLLGGGWEKIPEEMRFIIAVSQD